MASPHKKSTRKLALRDIGSDGRETHRELDAAGACGCIACRVPDSYSSWAGNTDEVNAGIDVTLSGGAVVASTYTGAALWYNPAGIARIKKASLEITGITFQTQIVRVPGFVTIGTDPRLKAKERR